MVKKNFSLSLSQSPPVLVLSALSFVFYSMVDDLMLTTKYVSVSRRSAAAGSARCAATKPATDQWSRVYCALTRSWGVRFVYLQACS
jgi:hypothetical protein